MLVLFSHITWAQKRANQKQLDSVMQILFVVDQDDQKYRNQLDDLLKQYGRGSRQMDSIFNLMKIADEANLKKVNSIVDKFGWLGRNVIGSQCSIAMVFVVQHSDLPTQEKYLPVLRKAVENRDAEASDLALLEDRVAVRKGLKQKYGSQVSWNMKSNTYVVCPIDDPDGVDVRRMQMGLNSMEEYLRPFNLQWNVEHHKMEISNQEKQ